MIRHDMAYLLFRYSGLSDALPGVELHLDGKLEFSWCKYCNLRAIYAVFSSALVAISPDSTDSGDRTRSYVFASFPRRGSCDSRARRYQVSLSPLWVVCGPFSPGDSGKTLIEIVNVRKIVL